MERLIRLLKTLDRDVCIAVLYKQRSRERGTLQAAREVAGSCTGTRGS